MNILTEIKIRVKEVIKDKLVRIKEKTGLSFNYQINFAIFKYLILDTKVPFWELDTRPDPHYEDINKLPEDSKIDYLKETEKPKQKPLVYANQDKGDLRGKK